jgi:hypothetical protein
MQQRPSEADSRSAGHEIPSLLWNPKINSYFHKNSPLEFHPEAHESSQHTQNIVLGPF